MRIGARRLHEEYLPIVRETAGGSALGKPTTRRTCSREPLLGAGLLLREELERIEELAVGEHLVVEVVAGRPAGGADVADEVAALHLGALLDREVEQVAVARLETEAVVEDDRGCRSRPGSRRA